MMFVFFRWQEGWHQPQD